MNSQLRLRLAPDPTVRAKLLNLQGLFVVACNFLAETSRMERCRDRVRLHQTHYRDLRNRFPELGSQMTCNVIYSVSRAWRIVLAHPHAPARRVTPDDAPWPRLRFSPQAPVFFDRHTLSIQNRVVSLFTLDGRIRFEISLDSETEANLKAARLLEIVLTQQGEDFELVMTFTDPGLQQQAARKRPADQMPSYLTLVLDPPGHDASVAPWPAPHPGEVAPMNHRPAP